ncbi:MAG: glycosyltransferase family 1 protein [Thermodesulfovibrionales bacterium]|nr:glycosyltransferase family 1 protein [Thermodesulfovibrionales bacterium]
MIAINSRFLTQKVSGVQRYAIEISKQLKKLYPETRFAAPKNIIHRELAERLEAVEYGTLTGHLWEQIELPKYLKENNNPLLINLANTAPLSYNNQIVTICDLSFLRNPKWFSKKFYFYYKFLIPRIAKNSLKIITISEFSKNEIIELLDARESKIKVIHCGGAEEFANLIDNDSVIDYRTKKYILSVSTLGPRKNLESLILAFRKLKVPDIQLIIVGSKNNNFANNNLKNLINADKNIIFTGYISDIELVSLYRNAMLFVYPSLYEGFGLPPLEAMGCGVPVVVSNVASLPEICGNAAYYVDPYNVESIAEGIYKVLTDEPLRQSLIKKGLERVKLFSWEKSAKEHIKVFEEVLNS